MELKTKHLALSNQIGYETTIPEKWTSEQLCQEVFKSSQNFIFQMLEQGFYSDGPTYFVINPFKAGERGFFSKKKRITIFTTFGNDFQKLGENKSSIIFTEHKLVKSDDYIRLSPAELDQYYRELSSKYNEEQLENILVYHVLFYQDDDLLIDVYSEVM